MEETKVELTEEIETKEEWPELRYAEPQDEKDEDGFFDPERNLDDFEIKEVQTGMLSRDFSLVQEVIDEEARTVEVIFSSEQPVERQFGNEILDHDRASVRLGRLEQRAPVLLNHSFSDQVGVVESASIGPDKKGRASLKFGRGRLSSEIFQDIVDGIRSQVSVGYKIYEMERTEDESTTPTYRATDWQPMEISVVPSGADPLATVGRSSDQNHKTQILERKKVEQTQIVAEPTPTPVVDEGKIRETIQKAELARISEIESYGEEHGEKDLARKYIVDGRTVPEFQCEILEKIKNRKPETVHAIGMTPKELPKYSWMKLIRALANPSDRKLQDDASFEFEASRAQSDKNGIDPQGAWVPSDVIYGQQLEQRADLIVGTDSLGGYTVQTDVLSNNFIDVMRANMVFGDVGVTELNGLNGKVSIPGISAGSTAYWVAENGAITESNQTFIARTMDGKTVGAYVDIGASLLKQSSMDVEAFVRNDIARTLAVEIENKGIVGDGSSNAPTGVNSTSGITMETLATADTPLQSDIVNMWKGLASNNALRGNLNWVGASTALANMMATPRTTTYGDIMILDPNTAEWRLMGYPVYASENCVFSSVNKLFLGDWSSLVWGSWGNGLQINVDPYSNSTTGAVRVVGLYLTDFCVRNPKSFAGTTNP